MLTFIILIVLYFYAIWFPISRYSKLVDIIKFRIGRYALAHSFVYKHGLHRSLSPLRSLFNLCLWTFSLSQMSKRKLAFILPWREKVRESERNTTNSYQLILNTCLIVVRLYQSKLTCRDELTKTRVRQVYSAISLLSIPSLTRSTALWSYQMPLYGLLLLNSPEKWELSVFM